MNNLNNTQEQTTQEANPKQARIKLIRTQLKARSEEAREYRQQMMEEADTVEEALIWESKYINDILKEKEIERTGATQFNTLPQWNKLGYTIKKGEKAFVIWGVKRTANASETEAEPQIQAPENTEEPQNNEYDFYPLCFLFSDLQVVKSNYTITPKNKRPSQQKKNSKVAQPERRVIEII